MAKTSMFRISVTAAAVFLFLSGLPGCGGGGGGDTAPPDVKDTTPPYVLADQVTPASGTILDDGKAVTITVPFSEVIAGCPSVSQGARPFPIETKSASGVTGTVEGLWRCHADKTKIVAAVPPNTLHGPGTASFTVAGGATDSKTLPVTDLAGNKMVAPYTVNYTVAAPPAKLSYQNVVVMRWRFNTWLDVVDRTAPEGHLPVVNKTPWPTLYSLGIRSPRSDCLMEVTGLDGVTGERRRALLNVVSRELIADPSPVPLDRNLDFMFNTPYDPVNHPTWAVWAQNTDGWHYAPGVPINVWFMDNAGVARQITNTTFDKTGEVLGLWSFSCTAP